MQGEQARADASRERIALFDNLKGVLIALVVFGHVMHPIHNDNPALSCAFDIIYLFHMPLFVLISGLFAKGAWRDGRLNLNRVISFVVLGLAYQAALLAINGVLLSHPGHMLLFTSAPWYLIAMSWWYLATPALAHLGPRRGMVLATALSLAWGCVDLSDGFLALSRTFAFLPCFAFGYYARPQSIELLKQRPALWLAVAAAGAIALARVLDAHAYDAFFPLVYGDNPYADLALLDAVAPASRPLVALAAGSLLKLLTLAVAAVFSLAVLKLVPRGASRLTALGRRTLPVYVLHRLIRAWLTFHTSFYDIPLLLAPLPGFLAILALSAGITALTALKPLERPFTLLLKHSWIAPRSGC